MQIKVAASVIAGLCLGLSGLANADSVEDRLQRIENLLGNQVMMEQLQQMEQIRLELSEIRELVENQDHELDMIKQRQRNLYQDMDRRLHELEAGGGSGSASIAPVERPVSPMASPVLPPVSMAQAKTSPDNQPQTMPVSPDSAADADGRLAYGQAFNLLKEGRYQQAIMAFRDFMQRYPQSKYTANAQYWLAEANYVSRDYKAALNEFQAILAKFPESNKVQGAELKIGYTYYEMNDWASARTALETVKTRYPNTTVARKADERLQRMTREGR
jgi:tol-pal system protein YbgF